MTFATFVTKYQKYLSKRNTLLLSGITLLLLLGLPALVFLNSQQQNLKSQAAGAASIEPENGTIAGNVTIVNDANASGGKYVQLSAATVSNKNIAIMPDFWDSKWLSWNDGYNSFPVAWQGGANSLHIVPNPVFIQSQRSNGWTGENEINGMLCDSGALSCPRNNRTTRVPVAPGYRVVYGAWVWVTPTTVGASHGGGLQMFIDVYGSSGRIKELQGEFGEDNVGRLNVPFGSTGWKYLEMHFTVKNTYQADGALGVQGGSVVVPTGIIPILQLNNWDPVNGYNEKATAYVRDTVLYVTPL